VCETEPHLRDRYDRQRGSHRHAFSRHQDFSKQTAVIDDIEVRDDAQDPLLFFNPDLFGRNLFRALLHVNRDGCCLNLRRISVKILNWLGSSVMPLRRFTTASDAHI